LHQSARSRGYKLSRERADPRSLRKRCVVCVLSFDRSCPVEVNSICLILGVAPAFPFIISKERARVKFAVKR
jgi:hypothetical protein